MLNSSQKIKAELKDSPVSFYKRRKTRVVSVGQVSMGGHFPIRIQSMITASTTDTPAVIAEMEELIQAGCEIIRVTVPTKADLSNLSDIRRVMKEKGIKVPLVADIHFTPSIAIDVVPYVDKVRINPGNFVDKKLFKTFEISDEDYQEELARLREKFIPLIKKCQEHGVAMRIGTNHGSLSDRILNRYGDTPEGMVESALEFLRIAREFDYHEIVLSIKASNTQVMVTAYRLLVQKMDEEGFDYPLHLGVTEAGNGDDGRIKSAVGIMTLLEEGIGDTIRVSLTEDSRYEIPVALEMVNRYNILLTAPARNIPDSLIPFWPTNRIMKRAQRRHSTALPSLQLGGTETLRVWTKALHINDALDCDNLEGLVLPFNLNIQNLSDHDLIKGFELSSWDELTETLLQTLHNIQQPLKVIIPLQHAQNITKLKSFRIPSSVALEICLSDDLFVSGDIIEVVKALKDNADNLNVILSVKTHRAYERYTLLAEILKSLQWSVPLHLVFEAKQEPLTSTILEASCQVGALLLAGIGDSVQINDEQLTLKERVKLSYDILQACRVRMSKTEYIACPSCGRTQFNLQEVTTRIQERTNHLKGLKIAVMGCIVNGPGEMADADFGYVGTGVGKVSLYVKHDCVKRNIPEDQALEELIALIDAHGQWQEPTLKG